MVDPQITSEASHFDQLYPALGRLLVACSRMEFQIRCLVSWLAGDDDAGWIVFEGQSVEWLLSTGKALLEHLRRGTLREEHTEAIAKVFAAAQALNGHRNFFAHGDWGKTCYSENECQTRAGNLPPDERLFHVTRSRYRKGFQEREVAVSDVEALAEEVVLQTTEMRTIRRAIGDMPYGPLHVDL